jgi:hypothetical protein
MNECVGLCESWQFRFVIQPDSYYFNDSGQIDLQLVSRFDYPIFEEQELWTFDAFTAALGNVLCFYVGLDFLTIVQFLAAKAIHLVEIFCVLLGRRNEQREGDRQ